MSVSDMWMRRPGAAALAAIALVAGGLVASGCGEGGTAQTAGTAPGGGTATVALADGNSYTVTLAEGQAAPVDIFGDPDGKEVFIYQPGSGTNVEEPQGAMFAVALDEPAGTGYTWRATGGTASGTVVATVQNAVITTGDGAGAAGTHYWVYRAAAPGSGTLTFDKFASGSEKASGTATFRVTVTD
jgi:predicted secreted protein